MDGHFKEDAYGRSWKIMDDHFSEDAKRRWLDVEWKLWRRTADFRGQWKKSTVKRLSRSRFRIIRNTVLED